MRLTVLVADSAQLDSRGKVHALGIGAHTFPTPTTPISLVLMIDMDANDIGSEMHLSGALRVRGTDAIVALGPEEDLLEFEEDVPTARGAASRAVAILDFVGGLPIDVGDYYWEVRIDGTEENVKVPIKIIEPPEEGVV